MKYLSLFSGVGGFELGIQQAYENNKSGANKQQGQSMRNDIQRSGDISNNVSRDTRLQYGLCNVNRGKNGGPLCIGFSEIDKYAVKTYQHHFPTHKNYGDVTKINAEELPDFDLLVGGFPCQSFSIAGKRGGFNDTRGTLFFEVARIIKQKQPRLLLLENVKGLLSHDKGNTFRTIISTIDELGYDCQWQVLNSKNFGVPQNRERVFIVGHLRRTSRPEVFPIIGSSSENKNRGRGLTPINFKHKAGDGMSTRLRRKTELCCTLAAKPGQNGAMLIDENPKIRRLTPIECERLQGFPESEKSVIIEVCAENLKHLVVAVNQNPKLQKLAGSVGSIDSQENATSAMRSLLIKNQQINKHVQPSVLISCEENGVEILSQGKSLLNAKGATKKNWSAQLMPIDDFVQMSVGINTIVEKIIRLGGVESHQSEQCLIAQKNGKKHVRLFGKEITQLVEDVKNDLITLKKPLKYTTSNHLDIKSLEQELITLFSYVIFATNGFIPKEILSLPIFVIELKTKVGWTNVEGMSDTQRYKQMGNAVTVNVIQEIIHKLLAT